MKMNPVEYSLQIVKELETSLSGIDAAQTENLADAILASKRIFVAGAGRSLLMMKGFAMRLMHVDLEAYVVGETLTPAIEPGDLLVIGSGSGETGSLTVMANKAKEIGVKLALITIFPDSTIGKIADYLVRIPATTSKSDQKTEIQSIQPGASLFEQSLLLIGDSIVIRMNEKLGVKGNKLLMLKHANLE